MICQGMYVVLAICLVVAVVVKVSALSFALPQRHSSALGIQWPPPAFCYRMNSTFRQPNVTTALLVSCSASNKLLAYFPLLQ
uniref:Uncharacterized protein LOC105129087 n=1 Tax=Rhizophora mucronata TaxID=61149 RepID=A0A2P2KH04_RHIMU